jgi:uncharacterized membrane protein
VTFSFAKSNGNIPYFIFLTIYAACQCKHLNSEIALVSVLVSFLKLHDLSSNEMSQYFCYFCLCSCWVILYSLICTFTPNYSSDFRTKIVRCLFL